MSPNCNINEARFILQTKLNIVFEAILLIENRTLIDEI
jgi:hypothetical protein